MRYHGTLAPNAAWRKLIVPEAPEAQRESCGAVASDGAASKPERMSWAELVRRVFARDVLECPRCGDRMKIIATVMDPDAVRKILTCTRLPARPPPVAPAREREQAELGFAR